MIVCGSSAAEVLAWRDAAGFLEAACFAVEDLRLLGAIAARWRAPLDYLHVFALEQAFDLIARPEVAGAAAALARELLVRGAMPGAMAHAVLADAGLAVGGYALEG